MPAGGEAHNLLLHEVLGEEKLSHLGEVENASHELLNPDDQQRLLGLLKGDVRATEAQHVGPLDGADDRSHRGRGKTYAGHGHILDPGDGSVVVSPVEISKLGDIDASLTWTRAMPRGIEHGEATWSGRANDVLHVASGVLIASAYGGVWFTPDGEATINVGHGWGRPRMESLVRGPSDDHVLAAGSGLYVSEWTASLRFWRSVALPGGVGQVFSAIYVAERNTVVLADNVGVHYAPWPDTPADVWEWQQVDGLLSGRYTGLAQGPDDTVVVACWGDADPANAFRGISVLRFPAPPLGRQYLGSRPLVVDTPATMTGVNASMQQMVRLSSSAADRSRMYAAVAGAGDPVNAANTSDVGQFLLAVLRSDDGGRTWSPTSTSLTTSLPYPHDLLKATGHQGNYNNCIEASPVDPDVVVLGWCTSGPFLSTDGGGGWQLKHADQDSAHLHSDLHAVRFDTTDTSGQAFYVGSDGGVVRTSDLGDTFDSSLNSPLADLAFQTTPAHTSGFDGSFASSPVAPGVVAGGLQDLGVVWGQIASEAPWKQLRGGDGLRCAFLRSGQLLWTSNGSPAPQISEWTGSTFSDTKPVLVAGLKRSRGAPTGLQDPVPSGPSHAFRNTILATVPRPSHRDDANNLMQALGAVSAEVYGLFSNDSGGGAHWVYLATVPIDPDTYAVSSLGTFHGDNVYVGTTDGRIFALDTGQGAVLETTVTTRTDDQHPITHICAYAADGSAYAVHDTQLIRLDNLKWDSLGGLPLETLFGVTVDLDSAQPVPPVFVSTDGRVYSSRDAGTTWKVASIGLPERPQCGDLSIGPTMDGSRALYVATFGSSVWWTPVPDQ